MRFIFLLGCLLFASGAFAQQKSTLLIDKAIKAYSNKQYSKSKRFSKKAKTANPALAEAYYWYAKSLDKMDFEEEALASYTLAIEKAPKRDSFFVARALFYEKMAIKGTLQEEPCDCGNDINLVKESDQNRADRKLYFEQAIFDLEQAIHLNNKNPKAFLAHGRMLLWVQQKEKACNSFEKARQLEASKQAEEYIQKYCQ